MHCTARIISETKIMNRNSQLKIFKTGNYSYVYIYFKHGKNIIRINTKKSVVKNGMTKDNLYNSKVADFEKLNNETLKLKSLVDTYLLYKFKFYKPVVSQKECEQFIKTDYYKGGVCDGTPYTIDRFAKPTSPKMLNDYLAGFYNLKSMELANRTGLKDYKSLCNAIIEYQKFYNKTLSLEDINSKTFVLEFRNFLSIEHPEDYKTKGGLNDNTINKRLRYLKAFYNYVEVEGIYSFKKNLFSFKKQGFDIEVIALTKQEIQEFYQLAISVKKWEMIRDLFVFNCFAGLRFSDLKTLKRNEISQDDNGIHIIKKENQKTNITVVIPIMGEALEILKKYNFQLPSFSNQFFNRELKKIMIHYNLMGQEIKRKRRVLGSNKDYFVKKRDLVSSHVCRKTFITLGISANIPFNSLMLASGHSQLATMKKYVKKVSDIEAFKRIYLNKAV